MGATGGLPLWVVLLIAIVSGSGTAAIGGVVTGYLKDRRTSEQQDRSVAIDEVERAIPGLGQIITELRAQVTDQAGQIAQLTKDKRALTRRVDELERELGHT